MGVRGQNNDRNDIRHFGKDTRNDHKNLCGLDREAVRETSHSKLRDATKTVPQFQDILKESFDKMSERNSGTTRSP